MVLHTLKKVQKLPLRQESAWEFFSSPFNLTEITPDDMVFKIVSGIRNNQKMFEGMIIQYTLTPVLNFPLTWVTEITHVSEPNYFVDEQRFGPYAFWHHKHFFKEIPGGVEITDIVDYKLPFGFIGKAANKILVRKRLESIFKYREKKLEELFGIYALNSIGTKDLPVSVF